MDFEKIKQALTQITATKNYVKFICEDNCCSQCAKYKNKTFSDDDKDKPHLPIHPNCKCHFEAIDSPLIRWKNDLKNIVEATQIALEEKYLPTGIGEMIGTAKVVSILATNYNLKAIEARNAVMESTKLSDKEKNDLYEVIKKALANKDIKTILKIIKLYKTKTWYR